MDTVSDSIVIKKLDMIIKGNHILNKVDFQAKTGEITLIYGPSGSGKTTLLNVINFLYYPNSGEYIYFGEKIDYNNQLNIDKIRQRDIGYFHQEMSFIV
ncbi:MAG TPA: ATP-binding cassette domain-containing protein [Clostridiales bacterium]|nr:ATP-binding cassette domain-containing protein [Clostridiales bacterium]